MSIINYQLFVIIVAGGSGSRMKSALPKQFIEVQGKPILLHTVEQFLKFSANIHVILVLPENDFPLWNNIAQKYQAILQGFRKPIILQTGGKTRFQSVKNGLNAIETTSGLVAVHDGVRPFVSSEIIENSFLTAQQFGTAVTCVSLKDSARMMTENGESVAVNREHYRLVQTPQTFELNLMRKAFALPEQPFFTDCASVLENAGEKITLIEGSYENIKITTPEDLLWAEVLLEYKRRQR